ncbi:hypothetical protein JXB01_03115 [Candidatus Micrarchaeota archaeon]|nr:hypothetical protein [Candidatus Micrarchaeota archaeon]
MIHITQLKLRGFKSFKTANVQFPPNFIVLAGPNGSGKCVHGDTEVQLSDGSSVKIRNLVNQAMEKGNVEEIDDGFITKSYSKKIICLDTQTFKTVPKDVYAFVKRKSPRNLLKIKTKSGREITATEYHPLFVFDGSAVRAVRSDELKEGTKIAIPRRIQIKPANTVFTELLDLINTKDLIYVPYKKKIEELIKGKKGKQTLKQFAEKAGVSYNTVKGYFDKQPINAASLFKLLRFCGIPDLKIIEMIPFVKGTGKNKLYPVPWKNSNKFCRFLGYLLAEGRITQTNQVWFTNGSREIVEDYVSLVNELFDEKPTVNEYKANCWDVIFYSSPLAKILSQFGMSYEGTEGKTIPNMLLSKSSNENLGNLMDGLYSGDGYISTKSIEIITKSKKLAKGIEHILFRLGIVPRVKTVKKTAVGTGTTGSYILLNIYSTEDCRQFEKWITLTHKKKRLRLNNLTSRKSNPNVDLIEVNKLIKQTADDLSINIKNSRKTYPKLDAYCYGSCMPSRVGTQELVQNLFVPAADKLETESKNLNMLKSLSESDIFWDEVKSIKKINADEEWVYDLSVEGHHNFIANNIFVHNSNLCDAIRFVLGETSLKSIRAKKVKDLIFSDSNSADVTITFNGEEKYEIRRAIRNDGKILYRLNGKKTTRTSILEALKRYNLDESGRNVIAQGRLQRIVEMGGKERRQMIESVAGISDFEKKKNEALKELEAVNTRLREASLIMGERKAYLEQLRKEKEVAEKYRDSKTKLRNAKGSLLKIEIEKIEKDLEDAVNAQSSIDSGIQERESLIYGIDKEINEIEDERSDISSRLQKKQQTSGLIRDIEQLKASISSKKEILEDREKQMTSFEKEKKELLNELDSERKELESVSEELSQMEKELKKFSLNYREEKVESRLEELEKEYEEKQSLISELERKLASVRSSIHTKSEIIKLKFEQAESIKKDIEASGASFDSESEETSLSERISEISKEIEELFQQERESNRDIAELDKTMLQLKEKTAQLRAVTSPGVVNPSLAFLKDLKETGKVDGIYGTVAELLKFDSKHSQAVEAAAGGRLLYVIVSDTKTATHLIKHLKKAGSGRATFIPLDRIFVPDLDRKKNLLLNYLSYSPEVSKAMEFVFSGTVLVEDMEEAKKKETAERMVTLDGELFEKSGIITGGKLRKSLLAGTQLKKLESEIEEVRTKRDSLYSSLQSLREEGNRKRKEKSGLEVQLKTIELEKRNVQAEADKIARMKQKAEDIGSEIKNIETELQALSREEKLISDSLEKSAESAEKLKKGIKEEQKRIDEVFNSLSEKKAQEASKVSSLRTGIEAKKKELSLRKKEMYSRENDLKEKEETFSNTAKESTSLKKQITNLSGELLEKEEMIKKHSREIETLFAKMRELEDLMKLSGEKRGKIKLEIEKLTKEKTQNEIKKATSQTRLSDLKAEFDSYSEFEQIEAEKDELSSLIKEAEGILSSIESVNMAAIELYVKKKEEMDELEEKVGKLREERKAILEMINEIEHRKKEVFFETFNSVNDNFQHMFDHLSVGKGYLYLDKPASPFESNLYIRIKKLNKDVSIESLSGGESSLVALAFIFSIQFFKPAPFYILDEVDAALDKPNSQNLVKLIKQMSNSTQFLVVSHNDHVIGEAHAVLGVTKVSNTSKIVGVKFEEQKEMTAEAG